MVVVAQGWKLENEMLQSKIGWQSLDLPTFLERHIIRAAATIVSLRGKAEGSLLGREEIVGREIYVRLRAK